MGRKTSIYLSDSDLERIRALGQPPLGEVIRAGLTVLEQWPAQTGNGSQARHGGPASEHSTELVVVSLPEKTP